MKKREDFQRLINDCMNGDVDMVITKSISRFARNTLDTLKYVRMLKDKGVAVFFEEENINTLTMDGELLLVILSSVAQQEVENISANVKKGLKMKMQRGELVGFQGCLGYDYNPEDKTLTVNEEEAAVVRYIFQRYTEGAGGSVIAKELENLGYKTKRGSPKWADSTVIGIIKNEKYKGDILLGKLQFLLLLQLRNKDIDYSLCPCFSWGIHFLLLSYSFRMEIQPYHDLSILLLTHKCHMQARHDHMRHY